MDIYEAIARRRSVRAYKPDAVAEETLARVLGAGRLAPSGHNRQPWRVVVVREEGRRRALAAAAAPANPFLAEAPVVLAFLGFLGGEGVPAPNAQTRGSWTWDMYIRYNVAIAAAYVTLAAAAEGLGTCWINNYREDEVRAVMAAPADHALVCLMTLGWPAEEPAAKPRLPMDEIRRDERFR